MTSFDAVTAAGRMAVGVIAAAPDKTLLALDYDGTLAPIVDDPDAAAPCPQAMAALERLGHLLGSVAIITGREVRQVVRLGGLDERPGLEHLVVLGQYGVERFDAATKQYVIPPPPAAIAAVVDELPAVLAAAGHPDAGIEHKGRAVGIHTRRLADPQGALAELETPVRGLAQRHGLLVQPGRLVWEIHGAHSDKGSALRQQAQATGADIVVFGGDDLGDLPAFDALDTLRHAGIVGVALCSSSAEQPALDERADVVCDGPAGVAAWLTALADEIETRRAAEQA